MEASEDGRFVFAGLLRGSSEMLALDISDLPRWGMLPAGEVGGRACARVPRHLMLFSSFECARAPSNAGTALATPYVLAYIRKALSCLFPVLHPRVS